MKKNKLHIEEIKKSNIHKVPEGYFEDLPLRVMSRVEKQKPKTWLENVPVFIRWSALALPAILLIVFFNVFNKTNNLTGEEILASIETDDLIAYLESSEISTDDLIDYSEINDVEIEFQNSDADLLNGIDFQKENLDDILNDFDIENEIL